MIRCARLCGFMWVNGMDMGGKLVSLGAIDFGNITDGGVVMVEGLFVLLDRKAKEIGMERFNRLSKLGMIKKKGAQLGKAIFFTKLIIITALLPIFSFQKVEGKLFSPLAYTLGFALLGALIFTLTLVPVMVNALLRKNVREKHNPFVHFVTRKIMQGFRFVFHHKRPSVIVAALVVVAGLYFFPFLRSRLLPAVYERSLCVRPTLPHSISFYTL